MIYHPLVNGRPYDNLFTGSLEEFITAAGEIPGGSITVAASGTAESEGKTKLKGWAPGDIDRIAAGGIFDTVLVEADGAKHLPVKAPGENEPVIPGSTAVTAGVIGLDALGAPAEKETVFRLEYFLKAAKTARGKRITGETILNLVNSEAGLFKNSPAGSDRIVILNKADINGRLEEGAQLAELIMKNSSSIAKVIVCSMEDDDPVKKVFGKQEL